MQLTTPQKAGLILRPPVTCACGCTQSPEFSRARAGQARQFKLHWVIFPIFENGASVGAQSRSELPRDRTEMGATGSAGRGFGKSVHIQLEASNCSFGQARLWPFYHIFSVDLNPPK